MDMLQIYVQFSTKTTIRVHYFNIYGHVEITCPFLFWRRVLDQILQASKVEDIFKLL
jgi:hypothetical protein